MNECMNERGNERLNSGENELTNESWEGTIDEARPETTHE
jgi:hypothetical protein